MIIKFLKCGVLFSLFLAMTPSLTAGEPTSGDLSLATSAELFPLVSAWGKAASPGHFAFQVYGCVRPNLESAHAECDTAIGVVKGTEADTFFSAIEETLSGEDKGNVTVVPPALITCEEEDAPRCTIIRRKANSCSPSRNAPIAAAQNS